MFGTRYFNPRYFAERYFAKAGADSTDTNYGYFQNGAFAKRYFTQSYFPGSKRTTLTTPSTGVADWIVIFRRRR